ncbi:MAG TPA: 30S ribosomal protein S12 methylthiotransferase RimO [Thermoanaerobaculia bacterium]|nr:30S ribosomal protein S12 methylthiotransferase RimO [Thermoanaerobaculia bacterium]
MISLGCPKNLVDSEIMLGQLRGDGERFEITADVTEADVVIVNTCGFIDAAKQESVDTILEMAGRKGKGLERLIVTGCMVQKYRTELQESIPEIDAFVGLDHLEKISEAVTGEVDAAPVRRKMSVRLYEDLPRVLTHGTSYAYLKVSEGCSNPCTFCAIPQMRGKFRSRTIASLVREARQLEQQGVKELCLVAQDTTRYGEDLGMVQGLTQLVKGLLDETGFAWIRFLYAYPGSIDWSLFELMGSEPRFVSYCDIPLQHVSASVLQTMRRPGGPAEYREMVTRMRDLVPDLSLRTTFITGHPGETPKEFGELYDFVEWAQFDQMGAFVYSSEDHTLAARMENIPTRKTAERRRAKLMELQQQVSLERNRARIGKTFDAIITGVCDETEHLLEGRLAGQAPEIDGRLLINDGIESIREMPAFARVEITDAHPYDLVGGVVG